MSTQFDFTQALQQAQRTMEGGGSSNPDLPPIVYPGSGKIQVRLLFNPKANVPTRLINRHKLEKGQVPCLRTYGEECPICKSLDSIENAVGSAPFSMRSKVRGISYAQYVSSTYDITDFNGKSRGLKQGDVILLMYPWSVYRSIQEIISSVASTPTGLIDMFTKPTFVPFEIVRGSDNRYQVNTPPIAAMSLPGYETQEQFDKLLEDLPDLNESILKPQIDAEMMTQVKDAAAQLESTYLRLSNQVTQYAQPQTASSVVQHQANIVQPTIPEFESNEFAVPQAVAQADTSAAPNGAPECFGNHETSQKCLLCAVELQCQQNSSK